MLICRCICVYILSHFISAWLLCPPADAVAGRMKAQSSSSSSGLPSSSSTGRPSTAAPKSKPAALLLKPADFIKWQKETVHQTPEQEEDWRFRWQVELDWIRATGGLDQDNWRFR